jgi:hypothetical protein
MLTDKFRSEKSIHPHTAPKLLLLGIMRLTGQHSILGAAGAFPFLAPNFFDLGTLRRDKTFLFLLNLIQKQTPREKTIQSLLPRFLAFHLKTAGLMHQHHTRGSLVDVLSAMPAGAHERLVNIALAHAERRHAQRKLLFLFHADGKRTHAAVYR